MNNTKNQNPCLVAAYLQGACLGGRMHLLFPHSSSSITSFAQSIQSIRYPRIPITLAPMSAKPTVASAVQLPTLWLVLVVIVRTRHLRRESS